MTAKRDSPGPPSGSELRVPVEIELGAGCAPLAGVDRVHLFEEDLAGELDELMLLRAIPGRAAVSTRAVAAERAVRVRVHGRLQPYAPDLLLRLWLALAPAELQPLVGETGGTGRFPDAWFGEYVSDLLAEGDRSDPTLAFELIERLARQVVSARPGCLLELSQADAYLERGEGPRPSEGEPDRGELLHVLRSLTDLAVAVRDRSLVLGALAERAAATPVEDVVEELFVRLRPPRIELRAHPAYLRPIVAGDPLEQPLSVYAERVDQTFRDGLRTLERELLVELGLRLPDLECVPRRSLPAGMIVVRINDRSGPPTMGVSPEEVLVRAPVDVLSAANIGARPAANPAIDGQLSVAASAEREQLERLGLAWWAFPEVLRLTLAGEIRRRAHLLLDMEQVEYQLGQLEEVFPGLVEAALTRISLGDLTRILRGLLREGVSIRDLKTILERLVQYDSVPADPHRYLVLDERLPLADRSSHGDWRHRLEFVRSGLTYQLSERYARGRDSVDVYRVNPRLERLATGEREQGGSDHGRGGLDEELEEAARDALWAQAARFAGAPRPPLVYTTNGARAAVRDLLAPEFPDLPVVSAAELRRDIAIHPLGEIGVAAPSMRFARRG
jgi:hypothetical protein